jgi:hypothetical protein
VIRHVARFHVELVVGAIVLVVLVVWYIWSSQLTTGNHPCSLPVQFLSARG